MIEVSEARPLIESATKRPIDGQRKKRRITETEVTKRESLTAVCSITTSIAQDENEGSDKKSEHENL